MVSSGRAAWSRRCLWVAGGRGGAGDLELGSQTPVTGILEG